MSALRFAPVPLDRVPWAALDRCADRTVHQTRAWLDFLGESQSARPLVARIDDPAGHVGWFTGAVVRRYGVPILGSPLRGWSTAAMGCNLVDEARLSEVIAELPTFAWSQRCWHLEVMDRRFTHGPLPGFRGTPLRSLGIDLTGSDEDLLAAMTARGRRDVRRSLRLGAVVEEVAADDPSFVDEHYAQACEVFARSGRRPPYPRSRIESMVRHLHPAGLLLLLRVRDPERGAPIASGLFAGLPSGAAQFTLQASVASGRRWYPNELIVWEAMRRWRDRGATSFDLGGRDPDSPRDFKGKFGGTELTTWWLRSSRSAVLEQGRAAAAHLARRRQRAAPAESA